MLELVGVVLSVAVPAALAYGSSARRRLSLIREEVKAYDEVPESSAAKKVLYEQINRSVYEYQLYREQSGRTKLMIFVTLLVFISYTLGWIAVTLLLDMGLGRAFVSDEANRATYGKVAAVAAFIAAVILTMTITIISANRRSQSRRRERKRDPRFPAPDKPVRVKRSQFRSEKLYQRNLEHQRRRDEEKAAEGN